MLPRLARSFGVLLLATVLASPPLAGADLPLAAPSPLPGSELCLDSMPVSFRVLLGTGLAPDGSVLPPGTVDPAWRLASHPTMADSFYAPGPAFSLGAEPFSFWENHPLLETGWINQNASGARFGFSGTYTYERFFYVPAGSSGVLLDISYAADDDVTFYVDQLASQSSLFLGTSGSQAWNAWTPLPTATLTQKGVHRLVAVVNNILTFPVTPTGLNAEVILSGTCDAPQLVVAPCSGDFVVQLGTGRGPSGSLVLPGAPDPFWHLASHPIHPNGLAAPGTAFHHGSNANSGSWAANLLPDTGWINHAPASLQGYGGLYVYERLFHVPSSAAGVHLYVEYAADDGVEFYLEDVAAQTSTYVGGTPAPDAPSPWRTAPPLPIPGQGIHRLVAIVDNQVSGSLGDTGLNAKVTLTGWCR